MKKILGLDLGTNSIGWALIEIDHEKAIVKILGLGSRILPMDAGEIKTYKEGGKIDSKAAQRTIKRGTRRLNERYILRRDRLHLVLNLLNALPKHYKLEINLPDNKLEKGKFADGQIKENKEPKLAYLPKQKGKKAEFLFMDSYREMLKDIGNENIKNEKHKRVPYDWTLYYLRNKALTKEITLEEFAWVLLSYNQKRGYEKTEVENKSTKENELIEEFNLRVKEVKKKVDKEGSCFFEVHLDSNDDFVYNEYSNIQMSFENDLKEVIKKSIIKENGDTDKEKTEFKIIDIYELKIQDVKYEKEKGKHKYTLTYNNGWIEEKPLLNTFTYKYKNALGKPYDYIVETNYDINGNIKKQQGKKRKLREPDLSKKSNDWTLVKKKTEKDTLEFNAKLKLFDKKGATKKYISKRIYSILKHDAINMTGEYTKIVGGMFQVVDRDFYREELNDIIAKQREFHANLKDRNIFEQCVKTLYPKNKNHQENLLKNKNSIQHLLVEDILLYQRPLKRKKSEIANCKYEIRYWEDVVNKDTGEIIEKEEPVFNKAVSASHPYFQEFRIWDKLHNLRLIQLEKIDKETGEIQTNIDVTKEYLKGESEYQDLFYKMNNQKSLNQKQLLEHFKLSNKKYVWNFLDDEELKGNETRVSFITRFKRCGFTKYADFLTQDKEKELWHYLYSVSYKERTANNNKSITTFFNTYFKGFDIDEKVKEKIINDFVNYPKFASKYCAYSEKALKKLLPLIRLSKLNEPDKWANEKWYIKWQSSLEERKSEILNRLKKIDFKPKNEEKIDYSEAVSTDVDLKKGEIPFPKGLFNTFNGFEKPDDFKNLNLTQASYLVYGRHSELAFVKYWDSPNQVREELHQELKQHSLNNPVAEKVLLEMMQVVADIWEYYGDGAKKFFSRIHVEVGRELKKSTKVKESESKRMSENRVKNKRIRQVLEEFLADNPYNANPKNSDHFERLKIVEEGAEHRKNNDKDFFKGKSYNKKEIETILKKPHITKEDFEKYKLWIEQGYRSPYSGQIIKLTDLFDGNKYNIDHIFPQASVTNNSLSNKVVVEVALNRLKSDRTARAFIQSQNGQPHLGINVCSEDEFVSIVKDQFSGNKRYILLSKDIPSGFTNSQLNNSRYIARKAMELLSNIVREQGEVEFRSKNVLPVTGSITTELKRAWKLDQVWRELVAPRFIRLNKLVQPELYNDNPKKDKSYLFGSWQKSKSGQEYFDCNLDKTLREKDDSYDIKRIDHRHHALDALIVALCTEEHVNYINNINANVKSTDYGKQKQIEKYRQILKRKVKFTKKNDERDEHNWYFMLPGEKRMNNAENPCIDSVIKMSYNYKALDSFGHDYKKMILTALHHAVVTFKQNLRVINNTVNRYNNTPNKNKFEKQNTENGQKKSWAIRRQMSKETFYGKRIINGEERRVERELLSVKFDKAKIKQVSDKGVRNILMNHLMQFDTVKIPFLDARKYFNFLLEKQEIEAVVNNDENEFNSLEDFFEHLRKTEYKYKKVDYSKLNVFVDKVTDRDFRNEKSADGKNRFKIDEHPEIAFTPEEIEKMNDFKELQRLNNDKFHKPIRKIQTYQALGKERPVSNDEKSIKSKQYVVTAAGSNLYLGIYERIYRDKDGNEVRERKFKDIGLMDLIEILKQDKNNRYHPLPEKIYDDNQNEYSRIFTLSPLDLVYVPTDEEFNNPQNFDFKNLKKEQYRRIYKLTDSSGTTANFVPHYAAATIFNMNANKQKNEKVKFGFYSDGKIKPFQNEFGVGSPQSKSQNMIDEKIQIKSRCWKLKVNRLGQIIGIENNNIHSVS